MPVITQWPVEAKRRLRDYLQTALIDDLDPSDTTIAGVISIGRHRGSPARDGAIIEIYENDPDNDSWKHQVQTESSNEENPRAYIGTIGRNTNYLWRRFTIRIIMLARGITQDDADDRKASIVSRIEKVILDNPKLGGLTDDGGEQSVYGQLVMENTDTGGDDNTPIRRTTLWIQYSTYRRRTL